MKQCDKSDKNIYNVKKKRLVWVFQNRGEPDNANETHLKEGEV